MDSVNPASRNALREAAGAYVESLGASLPIWLAGAWNRSLLDYVHTFRRIVATYCSSCRHGLPVPQYNPHAADPLGGGVMYVKVTNAAQQSPQAMKTLVSNLALPQTAVTCLNNPAQGMHAVWVFVYINWPTGGAHAAILVFDVRRKLQIHFDPQAGVDCHTNPSPYICAHRFHPLYTPA